MRETGTPSIPACGVCGGSLIPVHAGPPEIVRCGACSLARLSVFPTREESRLRYQDDYYREGTGDRFLGLFEFLVRCFRGLRVRSILQRVPGPGNLLDVGCGRGLMLAMFRDRGWRVLGTQVSRTAAESARRRYGVDVFLGELPELPEPEGPMDVVTFFHVLEHTDRPDAYLRRARGLLASGGLLIVEVPNFASPGFLFLGTRNFCVDYPNHLWFFTPSALRRLLERCGFLVEKTSFFSLEYSAFTTLQNLLNFLPGEQGRLYKSLMGNPEGSRLRRSPVTWFHGVLAIGLAPLALAFSLAGLFLPIGNTMRFYCRKTECPADGTGTLS